MPEPPGSAEWKPTPKNNHFSYIPCCGASLLLWQRPSSSSLLLCPPLQPRQWPRRPPRSRPSSPAPPPSGGPWSGRKCPSGPSCKNKFKHIEIKLGFFSIREMWLIYRIAISSAVSPCLFLSSRSGPDSSMILESFLLPMAEEMWSGVSPFWKSNKCTGIKSWQSRLKSPNLRGWFLPFKPAN